MGVFWFVVCGHFALSALYFERAERGKLEAMSLPSLKIRAIMASRRGVISTRCGSNPSHNKTMTETTAIIAPVCQERKPLPDRELLKEFLKYAPSTGHFTRLKSTGGSLKGTRAGGVIGGGYRAIEFQGVSYREHRLAWLMHYGEEPPPEIDHENRNKSDNRIKNLRVATRSQNLWNTGPRKDNRSGEKNVYWKKQARKWVVKLSVKEHGRRVWKHFGYYATFGEAIKARDAAAKRLHGEFAFQPSSG
jgi:hypothetical protein